MVEAIGREKEINWVKRRWLRNGTRFISKRKFKHIRRDNNPWE